jgi:uncharacterized membrane protein
MPAFLSTEYAHVPLYLWLVIVGWLIAAAVILPGMNPFFRFLDRLAENEEPGGRHHK